MRNENIPIKENIDIPFENDENVVEKWETVGEYDTKAEFYSDLFGSVGSESAQNIYFLPNGERYWCYGWTKGKLLIDYGDSTVVSDYTIEEHNGVRYMFVNSKSYNYHQNGRVTVLVLRQVNTVRYSAEELARKDNICKPFVNDPHVLGKRRAHDFCKSKEAFFQMSIKMIIGIFQILNLSRSER